MGYSFRELSLGMHDDDVELLQESLSKIGYIIDSKEKAKKIVGKTTVNAIRTFQSENGLKITGKVDDVTAAKIKKIVTKSDVRQDQVKSDNVLENNNIILLEEIKSGQMRKVPKSLLESQVYFENLEDSMSRLKKDEAIYINQKLNKYFRDELLLGSIGNSISHALAKQLNTHIAKIDYTKYTDFSLLQAVNEVLTDIENIDSSLKQEILKIKELHSSTSSVASPSLSSSSSSSFGSAPSFSDTATNQKVGALLGLKIPLKDNHIFRDELSREKTSQYINLAGLNSSVKDRLLEAKLDLYQFPRDAVFDLVQSKVISEKQANSLKNIASIARITVDNPKFVRLLADANIKSSSSSSSSVADLISWKKEDWENFIVKQEIPLPVNVTSAKIYAENIKHNIERWYPTQVLLARAADSGKLLSSGDDSHLIDSVNKLLRTNNKLIESGDIAVVNWKRINRTQKTKMKKSLYQLISYSNFYKHLGIQDIINNKTMSVSKKKATIKTAINQIKTFNIRNPEIDLRLLNFFDRYEMQKLDWRDIPAKNKPRIRKQLMAYQRVLTLSDQPSEHTLLMTKGYDSAISIGRMTQHEFEATCGLKPDRARGVYNTAQQQLLHTAHNFEAIRDVTRGEFQRIRMSNLDPLLVNDLREIDGFEELFGPQNYCACQECMSILSPAAYFVDLMHFVHEKISKDTFLSPTDPHPDHPLYLKNRRSDLWQMQINCENTHTLIPYLTIVNEVLQAYLENVIPNLRGDIFKTLSERSQDTNISFSLPFNLPFEEIQLYLSYFGIPISDIYAIFPERTSGETDRKVWRSKLGLSREQFDVIVDPDPVNVKFRYGDPPSFSPFAVLEFQKSTGLKREQLDELLQIEFNKDLANITIEKIVKDPDNLQNFEEVLNNLNNERLDFIHRFIQFLRRTKWSIPELNRVLMALYNGGVIQRKSKINPRVVINIAKLIHIAEYLKLDVEELCCMVDRLPLSASYPNPPPNESDKKFFECIFDVNALFEDPLRRNPETGSIDPVTSFHHFSFNENDKDDNKVDPKMPLLLGGLGITEAELLLLFRVLKQKIKFNSDGDCKLGLRKISLLYRYVSLARALKFDSISDFVTALSICFEIRPAPEPDFVIDSIDHIFQMIEFRDWLRASSPFNVNELSLILFGQENNSIHFSTTLETVITIVRKIQEDVEKSGSTGTEKRKLQIQLLKAAISTLLNVSADHLEKRIFPWVKTDIDSDKIISALEAEFDPDGNPIPLNRLDTLINMIHEIERALLIFSKLKFTEKTVDKIVAKQKEHLGISDLKNLILKDLKSLTTYHKLLDSMIENKENRDSDRSIGKLLDDYNRHHRFSKESIVVLSVIWNKNKEILDSISRLTLLRSLPTPIDAVYLLWKLSNICQTLGLNGSLLEEIANDNTFEELSIARNTVLGSFSSKFDDQKVRQEKLEPYREIINKRKNDIFCDYILSLKKRLKFKNRNDIYSFFLLDPDMGGCARTSRIVSAISSLQLYVHRCLVNLEQSDPELNPEIPDIHVNPASIPQDEWDWRKNYRLWGANREVFLYPENYLEPDLRDNKTPQFKELEDELLQQKITKESVEAAYRKYVSQYAELARLVTSGASSGVIEGKGYYLFFGRTSQQPYQYYYRKLGGGWTSEAWTPWEKIDLTINSDRVSAIVHLGRLYIFWVETIKKIDTKVDLGTASEKTTLIHHLFFSSLNEFGKWTPPQKLVLEQYELGRIIFPPDTNIPDTRERFCFVYPLIKDNKIFISYSRCVMDPYGLQYPTTEVVRVENYDVLYLNLFNNTLRSVRFLLRGAGKIDDFGTVPIDTEWVRIGLFFDTSVPQYITVLTRDPFPPLSNGVSYNLIHEAVVQAALQNKFLISANTLSTELDHFHPELDLFGTMPGFLILNLENQQFMITYRKGPPFPIRRTHRINTSLQDRLGGILFNEGIEVFLSLETQKEREQAIADPFPFIAPPITSILPRPDEYQPPPHENEIRPLFHFQTGAYGQYYRELFFHIPFLVAHNLNANQRFKDAKEWYETIFDPASCESPTDSTLPTDRNWRYIEFRGRAIEKMRTILTDENAIAQYRDNPFNPHAIARLRFSAYQKTIVMKYIDNLIDWGDHLFAQDTMESINEASMLYVLAFDILGERPVKLGSCDSAMQEPQNLTYQIIEEKGKFDSEFLITLENWDHINNIRALVSSESGNGNGGLTNSNNNNNNARDIFKNKPEAGYYDIVTFEDRKSSSESNMIKSAASPLGKQNLSHLLQVTKNEAVNGTTTRLLFCIPENKDLLSYWDRVEDRLFKIRNCMNISGVRRNLALFQPRIEPMLLVKAKAAGLSIEDITSTPGTLPPYRFTYIIEKAKQFAQTVQNFGSALLGALEKKDNEELVLLRSVHERNILNLMKVIKNKQLEEAVVQYQAAIEARTNVQNRVDYYTRLIDNGLSKEEIVQETSKHSATIKQEEVFLLKLLASMFYILPQIGSAFAMKWGGKEQGDSLNAMAEHLDTYVRKLQGISESAAIRANFQRREQEWSHQLKLATQELKQMDNQVLSSDIRVKIAEKEIEIHDKNVEQANELDDFYRNKFTNLGLYNYLSTSMSRLYREAYNLAYDMALKAEKAYKFELDEETSSSLIRSDNWQFDRAGFLAGERLILQLHRLEKEFIEKNQRQNEITQSFSLALLDPSALTLLKENAECTFIIPEVMFDLVYPGQYKRIIRSVRITMPCVTGPYTNIGAKLTLEGSKIRAKPDINEELKDPFQTTPIASISSSSAQNDAGRFEFSFRDEHYLPFEGAGAVKSEWRLELPSVFRSFDYNTISDVILHISYTSKEAEDSGEFRKDVEAEIREKLNLLSKSVLSRLISLKHDFPSAFYKLLNPSQGGSQVTEFIVGKNYFPFFLEKMTLRIMSTSIFLKPKGNEPVHTENLAELEINGQKIDGWNPHSKIKHFMESTVSLSGRQPNTTWSIDSKTDDGFNKEELDDILILINYKAEGSD